MANAYKAYSQVSCKINATQKRGSSNDEIGSDDKESQSGLLDGYSKDSASNYGEQASQSQRSGAEDCRQRRNNSYTHVDSHALLHFNSENHEK